MVEVGFIRVFCVFWCAERGFWMVKRGHFVVNMWLPDGSKFDAKNRTPSRGFFSSSAWIGKSGNIFTALLRGSSSVFG
jgi:hypothetical protein